MNEYTKKKRKIIAILLQDPWWDMRDGYYSPRSFYTNADGDLSQYINGEWKVTDTGTRGYYEN